MLTYNDNTTSATTTTTHTLITNKELWILNNTVLSPRIITRTPSSHHNDIDDITCQVIMSECIEAAKNGELHKIELLCAQMGVEMFDASDSSPEGYFPLYWAACKGHINVCRFLLRQRINPDRTLRTGSTSLHAAADRGQFECATELIKSGCDVNLQNYQNFDTPLHLAAYRGHLDICKLLVSNRASITVKNTHGKSAHDEAKSQKHNDTAEYLYDQWLKQGRSKSHTMTCIKRHLIKPEAPYKRTASYPCFNHTQLEEIHTDVCQEQLQLSSSGVGGGRVGGGDGGGGGGGSAHDNRVNTAGTSNSASQSRPELHSKVSRNEEITVPHPDKNAAINRAAEWVCLLPDSSSSSNAMLPSAVNNTSASSAARLIDQPMSSRHSQNNNNSARLAASNTTHKSYSNQRLFIETNTEELNTTNSASNNSSSHSQGTTFPSPYAMKMMKKQRESTRRHSATASPMNSSSSNTAKQLNKLQSNNSPPRLSKNKVSKSSNDISVNDYIVSLEARVCSQNERISLLETMNTELVTECTELRSRSSSAADVELQKEQLATRRANEQLQVLLHEINELRKLLKSSEGRSRYLAKQLFHYQHLFESNNNDDDDDVTAGPEVDVKMTQSGAMAVSTLVKDQYDDEQSMKQTRGVKPSKNNTKTRHNTTSPTSSSSPSQVQRKKRKSSSTDSSSTSSRWPASSSAVTRDTPTNTAATALLQAIRPVFHGAGHGFLMSITDALRHKLVDTLPSSDVTRDTDTDCCLDVPGQRWKVGRDFVLCDDRPMNDITPGRVEGACSLVYRIKHQKQTAILKIMMNLMNLSSADQGQAEGHSNNSSNSSPLYLIQQLPAEYRTPCTLPQHRNIIRLLHHYKSDIHDFRTTLEKVIPPGYHIPLESTTNDETSFIVMPQYSSTLGRLVEKRKEVTSINQLSAITDVELLPEEFIAQKLFEVLSAATHLTANSIAHRDIKSDNIFLDNTLSAILGDFGMSRSLLGNDGNSIPFRESSQILAGNSLAWAPELVQLQARGPAIQPEKQLTLGDVYSTSDVYAVGVMFSSILGCSTTERGLPRHVSSGLRHILQRLTAKSASRYSARTAMHMIGIHLFGPTGDEVSSLDDCHTWLQAQMMQLLVSDPSMTSASVISSDATLSVQSSIKLHRIILQRQFIAHIEAQELYECITDYKSAVGTSQNPYSLRH